MNTINKKTICISGESSSLQMILKWTFRFLVLWIEMLMCEIEFLVIHKPEKCRNNAILGFFKFC